MPGGGFYTFVTYGAQNVLLSANPDMTFFYKVFRKHTHFSEESFTVTVDGPNELKWDQSIQVRAKIPRNADLVRDMYFIFTIPDIYSKYVDSSIRQQYEFAWSKYIGCRLIERAAIYIGGQKIQEFDGSYIVAKANLDLSFDELKKWQYLVGHVPELYDPANGDTAAIGTSGTIQGQYPTVVENLGQAGAQTNRPSIFGRDIYVPLPFWCMEDSSLALPLCALQLQEVEIQLTLRPIQELYTILDSNPNKSYRVAPGFKMNATNDQYQLGLPTYVPDSAYDETTNNWFIRNFLVDIGYTTPTLDVIPYNPRIYATYVYISDEERKVFSTTQLQYLVHQVTPVNQSLYSREFIQLDIHNPITRLITIPRRNDAIQYRNNEYNWTNWVNDFAPSKTSNNNLIPPNTYVSGILIPAGQKDIIRTMRVICDGNPLQDDRTAEYFRKLVPYKYYKGQNDTDAVPYPFSIKQSSIQPSGSINASRIKNFQIDINPYPLPLSDQNKYTYVYDITIYVESINWVVIQSGTGGLKYAL
jgi:hypothetical protein